MPVISNIKYAKQKYISNENDLLHEYICIDLNRKNEEIKAIIKKTD